MPAQINLPGDATRASGVVDFSAKVPVERTACGTLDPSTAYWRYVSCVPCLRAAPKDPRIEARLAEVLAGEAERTR
jgi:hypothetical protein